MLGPSDLFGQEGKDQKIAAFGSSYNSGHFLADEKKGLAKQDLS
jgi:hypothetical protein